MPTLTTGAPRALGVCAILSLVFFASPGAATSQVGHVSGAVRLEVHIAAGWYRSVGPGVRVDIPLIRDGLIPSINDEFALTLGVDALFHSHGPHAFHDGHAGDHRAFALLFPVAAQWNFILPRDWTVFPELGLAVWHHDHDLSVGFDVGFGARWHFRGGRAAALVRLTHPGGFQIGIAW